MPHASSDETSSDGSALPLQEHIELLHSFIRSRGVDTGTTEAVDALVARLGSPGAFRNDTSAMLRTVLYREHMQMQHAELLDVLCRAVGIPDAKFRTGALEDSLHQLSNFVNTVMLSLNKRPFEAEILPQTHIPSREEQDPVSTPPEGALHMLASTGAYAPEVAVATFAAPEKSPVSPVIHNSETTVESTASVHFVSSPASEVAPSSPSLSSAALPALPEEPLSLEGTASFHVPVEPLLRTQDIQRVEVAPRRTKTRLWVPAALALATVLSLLAATMFRHRRMPSTERVATLQAEHSSPPAVPAAKPSAYGEPLPAPTGHGLPGEDTTKTSSMDSLAANVPAASTAADEAGAHAGQPSKGDVAVQPDGVPAPEQAQKAPQAPPRNPRVPEVSPAQHGKRHGLFTVSSGVMGANLLSAPPPDYPLMAKLTRLEGEVILQAVISKDGSVVATHVLEGHHLLRSAAEHAVRRWHYRPYIVNGRPTDVETVVRVSFRLKH